LPGELKNYPIKTALKALLVRREVKLIIPKTSQRTRPGGVCQVNPGFVLLNCLAYIDPNLIAVVGNGRHLASGGNMGYDLFR
jgi:hypothetical protein